MPLVLIITEKTVSGIRVIGKSDAVPFFCFCGANEAESLLQCVFLYPADEVVSACA